MAVSKRTGKKSIAANDHLIPLPPGPPVANDVGTNRPFDNGSAVVNFDILDPTATTFKIYAAAEGFDTITATGSSSPIIVTGLKTNVLYTFTATSISAGGDESAPSDPSTPTLITSVPQTPLAPVATSPNANRDVVTWIAPNSGGKTITGYIWFCSDGKGNAIGKTPGGGPTTNTSVTVDQEAGTGQTYTVYAINANGDSLVSPQSNSITTTFSFAPFGFTPFGFTPFGFTPFGFTPFKAFGFSPFKAFGFTPFKAFGFGPKFGFTPFVAFRFAPFGAFGFTPRCVSGEILVSCVDSDNNVYYKKARDVRIGDFVLSPLWEEYEGKDFIDHLHPKITYNNFNFTGAEVSEVYDIQSEIVSDTMIFNNDKEMHFSLLQPLLAKKQGTDVISWEISRDLVVGDILVRYDDKEDSLCDEIITDVELISDQDQDVYYIMTSGDLTYVAGNLICC